MASMAKRKRRVVHDRESAAALVMESHAAAVAAGRRVEVHSVETGRMYAFDRPSAPCILGLSVAPALCLLPEHLSLLPELIEEAKASIVALMQGKVADLLAGTKVFKEDECVLCLDEQPDTVLLTCGHQCLHGACAAGLTRCPVCRNSISAAIRAPAPAPVAAPIVAPGAAVGTVGA